ncbi:uncharacterized protein LOC122997596 [Thunnus albacares]|uniref:uncharacterized protein LOC122997596 n=1 Tax=Thunnus albacares TaxID=8236 RepID=UPI001CF69AB8|nr:uncharacterized protein LOC122997596 [Thunnus albacares]XP_044229782.1 uncharacterized protein LOC122997596 [Thunnus albacares]XP_044229784.1 uncharacterized protein LOC122997596 [Thunnus albacares]XP_044229785.1 uncharacterized protein LOC122997596 [Thunnus albacares]
MNPFEERLSEAVRLYPHLYDASLRDYKDTQKTLNSWRQIGEIVGCGPEEVKMKWNKLRDRFAKAKKRALKGRQNGTTGGEKTPVLYTQLSWLCTFVKHRQTVDNMVKDERETAISSDGPQSSVINASQPEISSQPLCLASRDTDLSVSRGQHHYTPTQHSHLSESSDTSRQSVLESTRALQDNQGAPLVCSSPQLDVARRRRKAAKRRAESDEEASVSQLLSFIQEWSASWVERQRKHMEELQMLRQPQEDKFAQRFTSLIEFARTLPTPELDEFEFKLAQLVYETKKGLQGKL